jgi:uncharacterized protein
LQTPAIEIRPFKNLDLSGGVVIEAFPSVGLVSAVAGTYIISSLKLDQIAAMDSAWFPPVSVIYAQKPKFPARIYASDHHKIAVCLSEFTMPAYFDRPIAKSILSWAKEQRCSLVISLCGIPVSEEEGNMKRDGVAVLGVGSTDQARQILKDNGISQLDSGVVPGITGALLNEGEWNAANVIALIVEAYSEVPDARAVAAMVEAIDMLLPQIGLEVSPLYDEAERIESRLRTLREQARPARSPIRPSPYA